MSLSQSRMLPMLSLHYNPLLSMINNIMYTVKTHSEHCGVKAI